MKADVSTQTMKIASVDVVDLNGSASHLPLTPITERPDAEVQPSIMGAKLHGHSH